ncbi:Outer membrane protein TolC [Bacteroides luti]|jgi:Outer membrane protein|uniref:Outer membrane protein TolC n=1 Tax=Bacteroides luti TaxID=1297750 RepID=A0A1M4UHG0_9BACE|nr:TolC family protein [Bacteroides luti]SHE55990.1 Outer membrane protein TolC [Bacteroides luti]
MKKVAFIITLAFICLHAPIYGQLSIDDCYKKAQANYPQVKQYGLIEQSKEFNISNANKGYLPQVSFSAKATYQSAVTKLPITLPNVTIEGLNKDQYQSVVEVNQSIWDGGVIRNQKKITEASSAVDKQKLDVDMYAINDRVNQLFFGILLIDEQIKQNLLLQDELKRNYNQISAYITNGIANQADLDAVKVNQLSTAQRKVELDATRKAYREMLSALIGEEIKEGTSLVKPSFAEEASLSSTVNRPELRLFEAQSNLFETQKSMVDAKNLPKLGVFVQGGYGNPGLNMLKNEFTPYYVAGARLSWNFGSLYTKKNDKKLLDNNLQNVAIQKETFLFNTNLKMTQQSNEIDKIKQLMRDDDEIIRLRTNIKKASEVKVEHGTLSVTDLLRDINSEDQAKQSKVLHEIQLLISIYNYKNSTNN